MVGAILKFETDQRQNTLSPFHHFLFFILFLFCFFLVEATVLGTRWLGIVAWGWDHEHPGHFVILHLHPFQCLDLCSPQSGIL